MLVMTTRRVLAHALEAVLRSHLDRVEHDIFGLAQGEVALASFARKMRCEEYDRREPRVREDVRPSERLPDRVGAKQAAARARERTGDVEVPLVPVGVARHEVDRHAGAAQTLVLGFDLEPGRAQELFSEV